MQAQNKLSFRKNYPSVATFNRKNMEMKYTMVVCCRRVQLQQRERDAHVGGVARVAAGRGARARPLQPQPVRLTVCMRVIYPLFAA